MTPQEIDPDLPMSVQESLAEAWVSGALLQDWGNSLLEGTNKPCSHQDPGERSSDPTRNRARLACECPGVSGGGVGQQWPAAGSGALSGAVCAWDLLKEVAIFFITSTTV